MQTEWMEFVVKIVRLVLVDFSTVAAWPIVIVVLGLSLGTELKELLSRAVEVGPRGLKAVPPIQQQSPPPQEPMLTGPEFNLPQARPALAEIESRVQNNIRELRIDQAPIEKQREIFVREFSELVLKNQFQFVASQIFRSQYDFLRRLALQSPVDRSIADGFFEEHVRRITEAGGSGGNFDAWLAFLVQTNLMERASDDKFNILAIGREFVTDYAPAIGLREDALKL